MEKKEAAAEMKRQMTEKCMRVKYFISEKLDCI